ncbi:MAG: Stp1/IreP family PP2C-type Ser/Thr phosphatase [Acidiferrobacterales bacterium]|nr:Stp1/IreP family PP2C-type Ser/Thr phosphatase [Acidiferrobacterales bacterium]
MRTSFGLDMAKEAKGLTIASCSDAGMLRPNNEDRVSTTPEAGLAVVADGMGGHQAGEVASGMAVDVVTRHIIDMLAREGERKKRKGGAASVELKAIDEAISLANTAIFELSQSSPTCAGMGTTIVVTLFYEDRVCIGHVGDSRLYRLRGDNLELLTEDHSLVQELVARGLITPEEARSSVNKNLVTRALGIEPTVESQVIEQKLQDQDLYLLCTDGLNDVLPDEEVTQILREYGSDLQDATDRLIKEVNARGGPDNVSVVLVRTGKHFQRDAGAIKHLSDQPASSGDS